jgi:hypothetical protein
LLQRHEIKRKLGDIHVTDDPCLLQDRIAYKGPSWSEENGELMFNVSIILQTFDLLYKKNVSSS